MISQAPAIEPIKTRYHSLDALRAWAMSMGIVLHAAWIMMTTDFGAPMMDASASWQMDYLLAAIHTFRMQLFFFLAGLFACLLVSKRGVWRFALNRLLRIAIPMVLAWCVLAPLMMYQYNLAGIRSGAIQGSLTARELTRDFFTNITYEGVFQVHLWFIYHLCWIYVIVLTLRSLVVVMDPGSRLRNWLASRFGELATRPWFVLVLAAMFAPPLYAMRGAWGVDVEYESLILKWPGVTSYLMYFLVGWLTFRNIHRLNEIIVHWRWQLAMGLLLTVPCFLFAKFYDREGYASWSYPKLVLDDLHFDYTRHLQIYPEFRAELLNAKQGSIAHSLWQAIPEPNRTFVEGHETATPNQINGLLRTINLTVLGDTKFAESVDLNAISFSKKVAAIAQIAPSQRSKKQNQSLNREIIEAGFPGIIHPDSLNRPYYRWMRAAYSFLYSLTTWLLIFACIGLFQTYCHGESRLWRYFSDSSYWMYLAHLPIQFQILLWFGSEPWHWLVKFLFYVVGASVALILSYQFLVRPTWIGWLLSGKMVPLRKQTITRG